MFISIRDVPHEEQHLLYCSQLDAPPEKRPRRRLSAVTGAVRRALAIHGEKLDPVTFAPPSVRLQPQPNLRCA